MTKGIVVLAQNNETDNYVEQAALLAMSLHTYNNAKISLITNDEVPQEYIRLFDKIIPGIVVDVHGVNRHRSPAFIPMC